MRRHERLRTLSFDWHVSALPFTSPPVAKPGKGHGHVRARFLVSDYSIDAGVAGELMAAKFAL